MVAPQRQTHPSPMNLDYAVVYSDRRTIGITVERDRRVVVRAPRQARPEAVSAAVDLKRFWIWGKLRDTRKYGVVTTAKEFVAGESFLFLGQSYSLAITNDSRGKLTFTGRQFELS